MPRGKITDRIQDIYVIYTLHNKNFNETLKLTNLSGATLKKYITIQERLDFSLLENLDKKGSEKLTLELAIYLCNFVLNPDFQYEIYPQIIRTTKKERKDMIQELSTCLICCDNSCLFESTPCCNKFICEACLYTMIDTSANDLAFTGIKCPFCNIYFSRDQLRNMLLFRYDDLDELWRQTKKYKDNVKYTGIYSLNLYTKITSIIKRIGDIRGDRICTDSNDLKSLLGDEMYYGSCPSCTPDLLKDRNQKRELKRLRIGSVEKQCVNDQNQLVVLEPNMFLCIICKSRLEDPNDGEFKKCPHCGIKTIKPDGCNYIYCGDHRWCFICNERIENNSNGHNKHYHSGPGTSPYSNQCRESVDFDAPRFIIKGICDCSACSEHYGRPLCRTLDCMNRTASTIRNPMQGEELEFYSHCQDCRLNQ
jgi:hypothetical protein